MPDRRTLPRFEVVEVHSGTRIRFYAFDHLTKQSHRPPDVLSWNSAYQLVLRLASEARAKGGPLTTQREEHPASKMRPDRKKE